MCIWLSCLSVCMCVYHCTARARRGEKKALDPAWVPWRCSCRSFGTEPKPSEEQQVLLATQPSLQPPIVNCWTNCIVLETVACKTHDFCCHPVHGGKLWESGCFALDRVSAVRPGAWYFVASVDLGLTQICLPLLSSAELRGGGQGREKRVFREIFSVLAP